MQPDEMEFSRIIIAALRGGSGKTILSIGLIAAFSNLGKSIAPFKKGPDYIDAGWLALAAGRPCYNLDSFLLSPNENFQSFLSHSIDCDISIIEGNRGLYDGIDLEGSTSTAELAKLLKCPVILCVDCTKITRTMAAVVSGCAMFDPEVDIKGIVLNRVANPRHEKKLRDSIEHYCGILVLGAIPKLGEQYFPERHLGLVPSPEHDWARNSIDAISDIVGQYIDLEAVATIAGNAHGLKAEDGGQREEERGQRTEWGIRKAQVGKRRREIRDPHPEAGNSRKESGDCRPGITADYQAPRIGVIRDSAFQFYYPENIDALVACGAKITFISPLLDHQLPELDALYIGGGFPETHAEQLAANQSFSRQLRAFVENGFPIYAECGGLMYLGEALILEGKRYPMTGILPVVFDFYKRPQGHGYTIVTVERENPYYDIGFEIKGHEFHYSRVSKWSGADSDLVFRMKRGVGIQNHKDGILYRNVLATYTHIHALGTPEWAEALVRNAVEYKNSKYSAR